MTKGSAPTLSVTVNPATNRITNTGVTYDANGNMTAMPGLTMTYDVSNRLTSATQQGAGTDNYFYDPSGRRVYKNGYINFYGVDGSLLGEYTPASPEGYYTSESSVYFGKRLLWKGVGYYLFYFGTTMQEDRLGSVEHYGTNAPKYFSYGDDPTATQQNRRKFATYYRDATTALDYAQQRYYASTLGRFTSPDPYQASGGPADPQSWNRYAYVQNDPVNYNDPQGLEMELIGRGIFQYGEDGRIKIPFELWTIRLPQRLVIEPTWQWDALSDDCKKGLRTAMRATRENRLAQDLWLKALQRANAAKATLTAAADQYGSDWRMLAAIGIRETGFQNVRQKGGGLGFGVFQIDIGQNPSVFYTQAMDTTWAANWAANTLASNYSKLAEDHPNLDAAHLLQATAASWNLGVGGISGNPDTIDRGSTGNNYGSNIVNLMDCFD